MPDFMIKQHRNKHPIYTFKLMVKAVCIKAAENVGAGLPQLLH